MAQTLSHFPSGNNIDSSSYLPEAASSAGGRDHSSGAYSERMQNESENKRKKKKINHKNYNSRPLMEMPPCFTERESIIPEIPANKPGPNTRRGAELHTLRPVLRVGIFSSSGRAKRDEAPRQVSSEFCKRALKIH